MTEQRPEPRSAQTSVISRFAVLLAAALLAGGVSGAAVSLLLTDDDGSASTTTAPSSSLQASDRAQPAGAVEDAIAEAVKFALPGVVTIVNQQQPRTDNQGRLIETVSVGSGVVLDERGFILTNEHVIHEPGTLKVVFNDGQERPATLVSNDAPFTDLAILRVAPGNLVALPVGDSERLEQGETLIAIGSALFDYRNSVTRGIVSGLNRRWLRLGVYMEDLVQTDAAINTGNSGGPLINLRGEVVGINTNVVRSLGTADSVHGIAFAISSRTFAPVAQSIIERGFFPRPYFGIEYQTIDDEVRSLQRISVEEGAIVTRVFEGSPAGSAGIRAGDIILRIGEHDLTEDLPFINVLARIQPEESVDVSLWREGRTQTVRLNLVPR